jgi:predicted  nucleic acid-binding Zn-ribbon protein
MAEVIGVTSGLVALITFGLTATSSLLATIKQFKQASSTITRIGAELTALNNVLNALSSAIEDVDVDVTALKCPIQQCTKLCEEFEKALCDSAGSAEGARENFHSWKKLKVRGGDINDFRDSIEAYKSTISIALCVINM